MIAGSSPQRLALRGLALAVAVGLALGLVGCGTQSGSTAADPEPSPDPTATSPSSQTSGSATTATSGGSSGAGFAETVYDVGTTPMGPRLYREFRSAAGTDSPLTALTALTDTPLDPDYRTLWASGSFVSASLTGSQIDVVLADASLADRPASMTLAEAKLAVQQVVYTVQAATQRRLPVQFLLGDAPMARVLGVSTTDPVSAGAELDTLALVNVTTPEQAQIVSGSFTASGVASSFEGTVAWQVLDASGAQVLAGSAQTEGDYTSLTPWRAAVDVSGLAAGDYTFVASTGAAGEGPGPTKDTKSITIS